MSNLDNITQKILEEATGRVSELNSERDAIRDAIVKEGQSRAEAMRKQILERAKTEADQRKERHLSGAALKARDKILFAKQTVMDRVFDLAKEKLGALSDEEYLTFLTQTLDKVAPAEDAVLIVEEDRREAVAALELSLPVSDDQFIASGFQLKSPTMILNFGFPDLVDDIRQEVEADLLSSLFEKGE